MPISKPLALLTLALLLLTPSLCRAAEVLVVADTRLKPVVEIISGIGKTLKTPVKAYNPTQVAGVLENVVNQEQAKIVIALGKAALTEALRLPPSILVIYDMVVIPPPVTRPNTTGFYMATPAKEYAEFVASHLHDFRQIAVVGSRDHLNILARGESPHLTTYSVRNTYEFVNTLNQLSRADAILLLPDVAVLSSTAMEEAYLLSFRKNIPLLGVSEKNVKDGALLALVVDPVYVGRQIGEYASRALKGANVGVLPPSPPKRFDVFVNLDTARRMGIRFSDEVVRNAKRTYP